MSFAGKVWRLLVGIKDALVLLFMLAFFGLIFAALSNRPSPAQVRDGALLLDLDGAIVEEPSVPDPLDMLISDTLPTREYQARELVRSIDAAAQDDRVKAIALDLTTFVGGPHVSMQEVGEALGRFRAADKPIYAYAVAYSDDAMVLAAHASEVWVDPMGGVAVRGPGGSTMYYGEALERYGVTAHVFKVGTFKSAVEPYMGSGMSDPARENATQYLTAVWDEWRAHVTQARPQARIDEVTTGIVDLLAANGGNMAQAAVAAGMADKIGTHDEWSARVAEVAGEDDWSQLPGAFASTEYDAYASTLEDESGSGKKVGIVTIAGEISDGDAGPGSAGAARITALLEDALDDDLAALVVRVDSPGGTVTGSEAIRRAIMRFKDKDIPIAVSMGNYAASGGYWVSTPADRIFAQPETLTGSIGVFSVIPTFERVLADYGVHSDGVAMTPLSGQPDIVGGLTPETQALLQAETAAVYDRFLTLVATSRNISKTRADELGQGRVWTGGLARQLGLVDQFGDLDAAVAWAAGQAGLEEGKFARVYLASAPDPWAEMVQGLTQSNARARGPQLVSMTGLVATREQHVLARVVSDAQGLVANPGVRALCMECMADAAASGSSGSALSATGWRALAGSLAARIFAH